MHMEDEEIEPLTDIKEGGEKYQSVDKDGISKG